MPAGDRNKRRRTASSKARRRAPARVAAPLRTLEEPLSGRRFEPKPTARAVAAVLLLSFGGLSAGAGVYGQWLRGGELGPLSYAPILLVAGLLMLAGYGWLARALSSPLTIGDLGVSFELPPSDEPWLAWYDVARIRLEPTALRVESKRRTLLVPLAEHAAAARRLVAEAEERIPKRLELKTADRDRLGEADPAEGQPITLPVPQVTGMRCQSSGKELTFEQDVRLCVRCAACFDVASIPAACPRCGAALRT